MKIPELSGRLNSAVGFVRGGVLADVGTDHAHLPIYLYLTGRIDRAVASDINEGPLAIARKNIAAYGAQAGVETCLCDGLLALERFCPNDIAIFGMGGELIMRMVTETPWLKTRDIRLILQPMTKQAELRELLPTEGFVIEDEVLSRDEGKIYQTLCVKYAPEECTDYTRAEILLGRHNIRRDGELFDSFLAHRYHVLCVARNGKRSAGRPSPRDEADVAVLEALLKGENS